MRILNVTPIEVKSFVNRSNDGCIDSILIGKCNDNVYYISRLKFSPIFIKNNEILRKASLKMHCIKTSKPNTNLNICINDDNVYLSVCNKGNYEWDVSSIMRYGETSNLDFCIYTKDRINGCVLKEFEAFEINKQPILSLIIDEILPNPSNSLLNIVKEYFSTGIQKQTDWIDCVSFYKYYYFIQNSGDLSVKVYIEISPDKNLVFVDSGPFVINPDQTLYLLPMRDSRFVRITFLNLESTRINPIQVWFQGK